MLFILEKSLIKPFISESILENTNLSDEIREFKLFISEIIFIISFLISSSSSFLRDLNLKFNKDSACKSLNLKRFIIIILGSSFSRIILITASKFKKVIR